MHAGQHSLDTTTSVTLQLTARPEAVEQISAQIRATLDTCAGSTDLSPTGYSDLDALGATDVTWQIITYPKIILEQADNQYEAGGLADVVTLTPGKTQATFTRRGVTQTRTVQITPGGAVSVLADGELCWNATRSALACGDME
ncbi:hypothetical protein AB0B66_38325 [Catellatospora sp. NPDC049111]|uniref:hypothetical protein n=1 Tax=Catellatospora sp. NPDC049111 TaxID=3155271 RepID=UPI0033FCD2AB